MRGLKWLLPELIARFHASRYSNQTVDSFSTTRADCQAGEYREALLLKTLTVTYTYTYGVHDGSGEAW